MKKLDSPPPVHHAVCVYPAFIFEGHPSPSPHDLEELLKVSAHGDVWVRAAVVYPKFAAAIHEYAKRWLLSKDPTERALALHYIRATGARFLCASVSRSLISSQGGHWVDEPNPLYVLEDDGVICPPVHLDEDGVSSFPARHIYFSAPTLAETALLLLTSLTPPSHPAREVALQWSVKQPSLLEWTWEMWTPQASHLPLLSATLSCLHNHPQRTETLALHLALLHPQEAPIFSQQLTHANDEVFSLFQTALEKHLKRVGKIKCWVTCREILKKRPKERVQKKITSS